MAGTATAARSQASSAPGPPARRPRRQALRDIAFITFIEAYLFVFALSLPFTSTGYEDQGLISESIAVSIDLGQAALAAAGWGIGVLVTALLGFFAITVGGNYLYRESEDLNLQMRSLALVSELAASTAVLCALLITAYCLSAPEVLGQLLFVVPAVMVIVFVAAEVGAYLAPEPEKVISNAETIRTWAQEKAMKLRPQPPHGPWATLLVNGLVFTFVALAIALPAGDWASTGSTFGVLFAATAMVAWCCTSVRSVSHASRDRFSVVISWIALVLFYLLLAVAACGLFTGGMGTLGAILTFISFACALSTWFPRGSPSWSTWQWLHGWSLGAGALASSIRTLEKTDQRAFDDIAKAKTHIARHIELINRDSPTRQRSV